MTDTAIPPAEAAPAADPLAQPGTVHTTREIEGLIPHRWPFLLVDRIVEYDQAANAFRIVGERWPESRKAPDALLKLGYSQIELKQVGPARVTLSDVTRKFPDSDAARLAAERLSKLPGR